jgi:translation initiation factor IF-3
VAKLNFRVNRQIRVPEVRLIDEDGEQQGVVDTKDAMHRADDVGLDLVEVAPMARPPVCKSLDYGKFKYDHAKKERGTHSKSAASQLKELRCRPAIGDHDLDYRMVQGRKFLEDGHKVLVVCVFRGRQRARPEMGYDVMNRVSESLDDISKIEQKARMTGNRMIMLLSPDFSTKDE